MIRDAKRNITNSGLAQYNFSYNTTDCCNIPYPDNSFDIVMANHVLFYCNPVTKAVNEIHRVLKPGGRLICSTYSSRHMQEINQLVSDFDSRIVLSADRLYTIFGLDNGCQLLNNDFKQIEKKIYKDSLIVDKAEPLIEYIMSCHGNQNQYLLDRYSSFKNFVSDRLSRPMHITKEAGIFVCTK